jgi:hypothetical protein
VRIFAPSAEEDSIAQESIIMQKSRPGGGGFVFFGCTCSALSANYIFTVKGLASLKLRVDSAGRTISFSPV